MHLTRHNWVALAGAVGWANGILTIWMLLLTGLAGYLGWMELPQGLLHLLANPVVLGASGFMVFIEFFADKIPGLDSLWDVVHTVIRIPVGAALAAGVFSARDSAAMSLVAALVGGTLALAPVLLQKPRRGRRLTPRPSRLPTSVLRWSKTAWWQTGLWLAVAHPFVFLPVLVVVLVLSVWLIRLCWHFLKQLFTRVARIFSGKPDPGLSPAFYPEVPFFKE